LATKATTTIKLIDPKKMTVRQSLLREESWLAQTPQLFERQLLLAAYERAAKEGYAIVSDDTELITRYFPEVVVKVVVGDEDNLKITYPGDLKVVASLLGC
jgi:2-C-methyl-D-erythritol 4-phosphate cytidylyltransferase